MKILLLWLFLVCTLSGQTLTVSFSSISFLPGGSTTGVITFTDSTPSSNLTYIQIQLPYFANTSYNNIEIGPVITPPTNPVLVSACTDTGTLTALCLSLPSGTSITNGVILSFNFITALTLPPEQISFNLLGLGTNSSTGTSIILNTIPTILTINPLFSGFMIQNPQGNQVISPLGRGLYYDASTNPPSVRTLSWGGLYSTIPFTLWMTTNATGPNATPVIIDTTIFKIVTNSSGQLMLTSVQPLTTHKTILQKLRFQK